MDYDKNRHKFFGESARYDEGNEEEKAKATHYLELWKEFLIKRLKRDCYDVKIVDEQWGERPALYEGAINQTATMYLKLCVEADFYYELGRDCK